MARPRWAGDWVGGEVGLQGEVFGFWSPGREKLLNIRGRKQLVQGCTVAAGGVGTSSLASKLRSSAASFSGLRVCPGWGGGLIHSSALVCCGGPSGLY